MNKKVLLLIIISGAFALNSLTSCNSNTPKDEGSEEVQDSTEREPAAESVAEPKGVDFSNLKDGDTVNSPIALGFEVSGMDVEPAGEVREGYGHHHIIINDGAYLEAGKVIVADDTHIHYGKGQLGDTLDLEPGTYQLTLQFADGLHQSYGKDWAKSVTVTVE